MAYNILGITPGHNGSVALVSDGKLVFYLEEERLSKIKYEGNPLKSMFYILERYKIDEIAISGVDKTHLPLVPPPFKWKDVYTSLVHKFSPNAETYLMCHQHHLTHATNAFYNSGFKTSAILVIDSVGSTTKFQTSNQSTIICEETESIYQASYPNIFNPIFKSYFSSSSERINNKALVIDDALNITRAYEIITQYLGWNVMEAGKTMGLSSYGNPNNTLPQLYKNNRASRYIFYPQLGKSGYIDLSSSPELILNRDPKEWHKDPSKITNLEKDLAYNLQKESQKLVGDLVQKTIDLTGETNICISGGYGLNCVANYYMKKRFPNVNFYHEPLAHDAGNSIGAALYRWYEHSGDTTIRPRKTLYNGPKYSQEELLEEIKKYVG